MALRRSEAPLRVRNQVGAKGDWKRGQCDPQCLSRDFANPNVRLTGKVGDSQPTAVELPHPNVDPEIEIWVRQSQASHTLMLGAPLASLTAVRVPRG